MGGYKVHNLILAILYALLLFAAAQGFLTLGAASSAFHQIYGVVWVAVSAICISGIGIIHAIKSNDCTKKNEESQKAEANSSTEEVK